MTRPYRPEIDGLRAIAVLAVVLFHAGIGLAAGYIGVDVFFVISGYLITALLVDEWRLCGRINMASFYARRIRRLLPALFVVVGFTLVASIVLLSPYGEQRRVAQSAAASFLFVANLFFQFTSGGYFDPNADRLPLLHLWSLGVEEQFYLIWPALLIIVMARWPRRIVAVTTVGLLLSLALAELLMAFAPSAAFYQMPARFWELAAGCLIALAPPLRTGRSAQLAAAGIGLVLIATFAYTTHFPGLGCLPAVAGTVMLLCAVHWEGELGIAGHVLRWKPLVFIGLISYSLYLWHWPLLVLAHATSVRPLSLLARLLLVFTAIVMAWLSFRFVERPARRPDGSSPRRLVAAGAIASASIAAVAVLLGNVLDQVPPPQDLASRTRVDFPKNRLDCHLRGDQANEAYSTNACTSDRSRPVRVALWGDSHALAWQGFAWMLAGQDHAAAIEYTRDACAPSLDYDNGKRLLESRRCREFNAMVLGKIQGIDTVVLTARWPFDPGRNSFNDKFEATVRAVARSARRVIILGPTPVLAASVPDCLASGRMDACTLQRSEFDRENESVQAFLKSLAEKNRNVTYIDVADFFCNQTACPAMKDGYGLYWDDNHVSSTAVHNFSQWYFGQPATRTIVRLTQ
jgi:peptidoglycan/LPS O-acetylase OafA/YrhL